VDLARLERISQPLPASSIVVVDVAVVVDVDVDVCVDGVVPVDVGPRAVWGKADRAKRYKISRGEAMECAASLDVLKIRKLIAQRQYEDGIKLLERR
jgi:hypothetical protein